MLKKNNLLAGIILSLGLFFLAPPAATAQTITLDLAGGNCHEIGNWDPATLTCTLTADTSASISFRGNGITLDGNGHVMTGPGSGTGVGVGRAHFLTIKNLTIRNYFFGIHVNYFASEIQITNNRLENNIYGAEIRRGNHDLTISGNTFVNNSFVGIRFFLRNHDNVVSGNRFESTGSGVSLWHHNSRNVVSENVFVSNSGTSIYISSGKAVTEFGEIIGIDNQVTANTISGSRLGIGLTFAAENTVRDNTIENSGEVGIRMYCARPTGCIGNEISGNTVTDNPVGIQIEGAAEDNLIYNNAFRNPRNFRILQNYFYYANQWSVPKTPGTNIAGGPFLGGNLWSKPDGSGYSDNCTDADGDALCDVPYFLRVGNTDHLPLVGNLYSACGLSDVLESMDLPHGIANSLLAKAKNLC
ncbi:MAG: DUF1565 domain-containing protein, partial [Nitrospinaceae bacterium]|nr:DUF1565 domain-containing protein [Nitrospinaceae bacterium]